MPLGPRSASGRALKSLRRSRGPSAAPRVSWSSQRSWPPRWWRPRSTRAGSTTARPVCSPISSTRPRSPPSRSRCCAPPTYLPAAARLTSGQLRHRLARALLAIDPPAAARRYRRAIRTRQVVGYLTADGSAVISATGLPAEQAAAACARVDELAEQLRQAGRPGTITQIRADVFLRLLDGSLIGRSATEIIATLLAEAAQSQSIDSPSAEVARAAVPQRDHAPGASQSAATRSTDHPANDAALTGAETWPVCCPPRAQTRRSVLTARVCGLVQQSLGRRVSRSGSGWPRCSGSISAPPRSLAGVRFSVGGARPRRPLPHRPMAIRDRRQPGLPPARRHHAPPARHTRTHAPAGRRRARRAAHHRRAARRPRP